MSWRMRIYGNLADMNEGHIKETLLKTVTNELYSNVNQLNEEIKILKAELRMKNEVLKNATWEEWDQSTIEVTNGKSMCPVTKQVLAITEIMKTMNNKLATLDESNRHLEEFLTKQVNDIDA